MILHGKDILILDSGWSAVIAAAKSCEINVRVDTDEVCSMSSAQWKAHISKRKEWDVSMGHLVLSIARTLPIVDDSVSLVLTLSNDIGLPFNGFVSGVTIEQAGLAGSPEMIFWDTTANKFVGLKSFKYYQTWSTGVAYYQPEDYAIYNYNSTPYSWLNNTLAVERLSGSAIVRQARVTATKGSLAQGTFQFLGNGALTPQSLTTS